jgi:hypothetical protein
MMVWRWLWLAVLLVILVYALLTAGAAPSGRHLPWPRVGIVDRPT